MFSNSFDNKCLLITTTYLDLQINVNFRYKVNIYLLIQKTSIKTEIIYLNILMTMTVLVLYAALFAWNYDFSVIKSTYYCLSLECNLMQSLCKVFIEIGSAGLL